MRLHRIARPEPPEDPLSSIQSRAIDSSVPVIVLKPLRSLVQHGVLGIARSLGRLGVPVYWAHCEASPLAARSRYVAGTFDWDLDETHSDRALERLLEIGREIGRRSLLIPTEDGSSVLVAEHADVLSEYFIFPRQRPELLQKLANKRAMHALCLEHGVPAPDTSYPESSADVLAFAEETGFPVVLKRAEGWLPQRDGGLRSVVIANDADELVRAYEEIENPDTPNTLLQKYIPGTSESVWMFNGYFDDRSDCLLGYTGYKIRQDPIDTGPTTLGACVPNPAVDENTRRLMKAVGYCGILDIGYRYDAGDGLYKLLDVNPRIGSSFRLFVGEDGMDVARALYLDLTGQEVAARAPRDGRKWVNEPLDLRSSAGNLKRRTLTVPNWLRSYSGVRETAWFAADDPRPSLLMWMRYGNLALQKLTGRAADSGRLEAIPSQVDVNEHFDDASRSWDEMYERSDVYAVIHQERRRRALAWVDTLGLNPGTRVLEVGCGAGWTSMTLAERGYDVDATDTVAQMLERTREKAQRAGVSERVRTQVADVHALEFEDETFDLGLALGVIPWLHSPPTALRELARVLRPGGHLIVNADNHLRLTYMMDPQRTPLLAPIRRPARRLAGRTDGRNNGPANVAHLKQDFDRLLDSVGLDRVASTTIGFGPFTFFNREVIGKQRSVALHRRLQQLADRGVSGVRSTGSQYLVLARKREER
jgi:D-aspartate ligase